MFGPLITVALIAIIANTHGIQIDNQLTSANNDCFERIVLEAMIPPDRTFRSSSTNSIRICETLCQNEGDRCQTFALGISSQGNGTCQLSMFRILPSGRRPAGTIYDPNYDIYQRQLECNPEATTFPRPGLGTNTQMSSTMSTFPPSPNDRPTSSTTFLTTTPTDPMSISTTTGTGDPYGSTRPHTSTSFSYTPQNVRPLEPTDRYTPMSRPSYTSPESNNSPTYSTSNYPQRPTDDRNTIDRYPSSKYPSTSYPTRGPTYDDKNRYPTVPNRYNDRFNYNSDQTPIYSYPMLYEHNYPLPNDKDRYPYNGYAQNVPTVQSNYRPYGQSNIYDSEKPTSTGYVGMSSFSSDGNRYGSSGMSGYGQNEYYRPTSMAQLPSTKPVNGYGGSDGYRPTSIADQRPISNGYGNSGIGGIGGTGGTSGTGVYGGNDGYRPTSVADQRPINNGYGNIGTSGNGGGKYDVTEGSITTYFNPDDYYRPKPGDESGADNAYGGHTRPQMQPERPQQSDKPCFRRALAGKRVAPQWVRRTLTCERVEDCQIECGREKRFTCEGFNYRIDPSGRGQGICELIEVPLSEMDLYSSPLRRDENLLYHPDYDYYERDRSACRPSTCKDCSAAKLPVYGTSSGGTSDYYHPTTYRPQFDNYKPSITAIDKYRPSIYESRPPLFDNRPSQYDRYDSYHPFSIDLDRYDPLRPDYQPNSNKYSTASKPYRDPYGRPDDFGSSGETYTFGNLRPSDLSVHSRPSYRPTDYESDYTPYGGFQSNSPSHHDRFPSTGYLDRDRNTYRKPSSNLGPYSSGQNTAAWGSYGGSYGGGTYNKYSSDYWGLRNEIKRADGPNFNYFELGRPKYGSSAGGGSYGENSVLNYPGSRYDDYEDKFDYKNKLGYESMGTSWTRRPGQDECSVKSSEGFRLHKGVVQIAYNVPTVTECERMCYSENKFRCTTYSYRYSPVARENCLLCERPVHLLDYYADIEPDRDYDIYAMSDDRQMCSKQPAVDRQNNAQCFFRAIDSSRFFKSIVRDSLNVRSIGECEMECMKSTKFTCRAFSFRYGSKPSSSSIIDNCQLSDWPVRDMDKDRHLIPDLSFDIYERASYGHGCEIQPIVDDKHKKLCYLGYGSPAKLLSAAIKKVISVPSESECKKECIRLRESSQFKCYSFSYGAQASSYNCEMSDLDQTQLKLGVHYSHTNDRDFWLFAWNSFDWTCRDKVTTIGGNRVNNDRRMDIFKEPGGQDTWTHFTVSGKPCRYGSACEKNIITGFYSCELDGATEGAWDYCCKPTHPCGYSQGFDYPWCFVGDTLDQWRTCSDRYYPPRRTRHPVLLGPITSSSISIDSIDKNKGEEINQQKPPRPGGLQPDFEDIAAARLWPVTYLYNSGPPNSTELSNFVDCNKDNC